MKRREFLRIGIGATVAVAAGVTAIELLLRPSPPQEKTTKPPPTTVSTSASGTVNTGSDDYNFFVRPNSGKVEALRQYCMSPWNQGAVKIGYDPAFGMIRGDHFCGGFNNGFTLFDPNVFLGRALDYLNPLASTGPYARQRTQIESTARSWLAARFLTNSPCPNGASYSGPLPWTYAGNDRREMLFGGAPGLNSIYGSAGYAFPLGYALSDPVAIEAEVVDTSRGLSFASSGPMNLFSMYVEFLFRHQDQTAQAQSLFYNAVAAWDGTQFRAPFGGSDVRSLAYFLHMARATGFWRQNQAMVGQVMDKVWSFQNGDGSIGSGYGSTTSGGEQCGLTLIAHDPRLPSWFGAT